MYALAIFVVLVAALSWVVYQYEEEILQKFIEQANARLTAEVKVDRVDLTFWENFPQMGVNMENVHIDDQFWPDSTLLSAQSIFFKLNLWALLENQVEVESVSILNAQLNFRITKDGQRNYLIVSGSPGEGKAKPLNIEHLATKKTTITYLDERSDIYFDILIKEAATRINAETDEIRASNRGQYTLNLVRQGKSVYYRNLPLGTEGDFTLSDKANRLLLSNTILQYSGSDFIVNGGIDFRSSVIDDLTIEGKKSRLTTIIGLLPGVDQNILKKYGSDGNISLSGVFKGSFDGGKIPFFEFQTQCNDVTFYPKEYNVKLNKINFGATIRHPHGVEIEQTALSVPSFTAVLDNKPIEGACEIQNFNSLLGKGEIRGNFDIETLTKLMGESKIEKAFGTCEVDINYRGALKGVRFSAGQKNFFAGGEVILKNASFKLKNEPIAFNHLNGSFIFNDQDLAISNFSGKAGQSDFMLQGFFKDFVAYLFNESKAFNISADLKSRFISLDELLTAQFFNSEATANQSGGNKGAYSFHIPKNLSINFNCDIDRVHFKRFKGRDVNGHLVVRQQRAILDNVKLNAMGGGLELSGTINDQQPRGLAVLAEAQFKGINPDSAFYVFHNFNQDFITHRNLRGRVYADLVTYFEMTNSFDFISSTLESDIQARVEDGALLDFEPMQKLNKYAEAEDLANLKFSNLVNRITIKDRTIRLPEMEVMTNISYLTIGGTHTFDQHIDYHVTVPVRSFLRFGKNHPDGFERARQGSKLLLQIVGTTDDYDIVYDKKALKQKIKEDFRNEGDELKEIFRRKGKEDEVQQLEEEEYFNFESDTTKSQ